MIDKNGLDAYQCVARDMIATLTDMTNILATTKIETFEKTIKHMTFTLPSMKSIPATTNLETFQKTIQYMAFIGPTLPETPTAVNGDTIQKAIEKMVDTTTRMIDILAIKNGGILQKTMGNLTKTIPKMIRIFSAIDWGNFEPTDDDVEKAQKILNSEDIEVAISKSFNEKKKDEDLGNSFKIVLLVLILLYYTMIFISDTATITVKECTHNKIAPAVDSAMNAQQKDKEKTEKQMISELNEELVKIIPAEITSLFMIVTKNDVTVHQNMTINSKILGTLDFTNVVQFIEEKEDWTHILYDSPRDAKILEGWVLTKYLKEIK